MSIFSLTDGKITVNTDSTQLTPFYNGDHESDFSITATYNDGIVILRNAAVTFKPNCDE